jgi:hypothetical protein
MTSSAPACAISAPVRELLVWIARGPRTYGAAMEAWRSSCPRFSVWEDALGGGLVEVEACNGADADDARVRLTPLGESVLRD